MLRTDELDYELPEELIATTPAEPRDSARLLVVSRGDPARLEHRVVRELPEVLRPRGAGSGPPDLLVTNSTRVLPARFRGVRVDTGGHVEGLYVGPGAGSSRWVVLLKMRRMKPDVLVRLFDRDGRRAGVSLRLIERADGHEGGAWVVTVESEDSEPSSRGVLERIGLTPLPPYILAARRRAHLEVEEGRDRAAYQTVYATERGERPGFGSVAAPTAGLHFTPDLLARLEAAGVQRAEVTLDVGLGTFKPVETEFVEQHPMHAEWCGVPAETARAIERARSASDGLRAGAPATFGPLADARGSSRIIAVGTTAARPLESFESPEEMLRVGSKETRLLITPGCRFRHVDALLTNFHLPRSTLMAMVAALLAPVGGDPLAGVARLRGIYAAAVQERYRFYSYGDAMLILP